MGSIVRACVADSTRLLGTSFPDDGEPTASGGNSARCVQPPAAPEAGCLRGGVTEELPAPETSGGEGRGLCSEEQQVATEAPGPSGRTGDVEPAVAAARKARREAQKLRGAEKTREKEARRAARVAACRGGASSGGDSDAATAPAQLGSELLAADTGKRRLRAAADAQLPPAASIAEILAARHAAGGADAPPPLPPVHRLPADGLPRGHFEYILLDAPCSATGLRPRLCQSASLKGLVETAWYQRRLLEVAVQLLEPGGALVYRCGILGAPSRLSRCVYGNASETASFAPSILSSCSTCSISPLENESNVRWVLDSYPEMRLVPAEPLLGAPGMTGPVGAAAPTCSGAGNAPPAGWEQALASLRWLTPEQAQCVQRFGPGSSRPAAFGESSGADPKASMLRALREQDCPWWREDTIGFFVARFEKASS